MTREEAIHHIKDVITENNSIAPNMVTFDLEKQALYMAIEALKQPEQKKGKWKITDAYPHNIYCSECFVRYAQTHWGVWEDGSLPRDYCPNCGAKMDER